MVQANHCATAAVEATTATYISVADLASRLSPRSTIRFAVCFLLCIWL
jgi:hypothetical protein